MGEHTLTFVSSGYERGTRTVLLERGHAVSVHVSLTQTVGTVRFETDAPTPFVVRDSEERVVLEGTAPGEYRVPPGVNTVTGRNESHRVESAIVRVTADETTMAAPHAGAAARGGGGGHHHDQRAGEPRCW